MSRPELLAPAGTFAAFQAALSAGADAVYLGGNRFGARAFAGNLEEEELLAAIDLAHLHDRKLYLTVNTLCREEEVPALYEFLLPLYEAGLDAVIVQDFGALLYIKNTFPGLALHASTQMAVTGEAFASLLKDFGVSRIVPARELSLSQIKTIHEHVDMEIECFVHGALCYCVSGMCLMSSFIGGRSGNRGKCAQPCRLPYTVYDERKKQVSDETNAYALNTKDMCTVELLPDLLSAGVCSFKIEGRMKRPEYVAGVVSVYRKALDRILEGNKEQLLDPSDKADLLALNNRDGFHKSYYFQHNGPSMMALANKKLSVSRQKQADALYQRLNEEIIGRKLQLPLTASFALEKECPASAMLSDGSLTVTYRGDIPDTAKNSPLSAEELKSRLSKTGNTDFTFSSLAVHVEDGLFLAAGRQNSLRRDALSAFRQEKCGSYRRPALTRPEIPRAEKKAEIQKPALAVSVSTQEQLKAVQEFHPDRLYIPLSFINNPDTEKTRTCDKLMASGTEIWLELPYITDEDTQKKYEKALETACKAGYSFLVRNAEDLGLLIKRGLADRVRADYTLYTMNSYARDYLSALGISAFTAPLELNYGELKGQDLSKSELVVYGRTHLMVSAQCLRKNYASCIGKGGVWTLKDRTGTVFPVVLDCSTCRNIIYNSVPLSLLGSAQKLKALNAEGYRISFTFETRKETEAVLKAVFEIFRGGRTDYREDFRFTRGHFSRGV